MTPKAANFSPMLAWHIFLGLMWVCPSGCDKDHFSHPRVAGAGSVRSSLIGVKDTNWILPLSVAFGFVTATLNDRSSHFGLVTTIFLLAEDGSSGVDATTSNGRGSLF